MTLRSTRKVTAILAVLAALLALTAACKKRVAEDPPGEWRQFRGPRGQGISADVGLPERWGPKSDAIQWRTRIPGAGNSSPITTGGRVFLTTSYAERADNRHKMKYRRGALKRVVVALDLADGRILWETEVFEGPTGNRHWLNTAAAPTPATDGERVYALFDAKLAALDLEGRVIWMTDLEPDHLKYTHYGVASSPILTERSVIVQQDREEAESGDAGWIAALDKKSGKEIWRKEWRDSCCSYTTPILYRNGGREELLCSISGRVVSYDPATGEELWRAEHPNIQPVPSMVSDDSRFFVPGAIHNRALAVFRLADGATEPQPAWTTTRGAPEIVSPVLYMGKLFQLTEGGVLTAFDPETGDVAWKKRLLGGTYRASLVAGDGKVYALNEAGVTSVVNVQKPKGKVISKSRIPGESTASPAIADGCLLIRGKQDLFRICKPEKDAEL